ncbi:MAG: Bug family tripartite tricarboxylate transporter substrate binding protein [Burkholderiales bacterium]
MNHRSALFAAATLILPWLSPLSADAADYPTKAVRIVVPFAPGGASDLLARAIATPLSERLGQSVVVENRAGAGGTLGADLVAKAAADGHTLLLSDVAAYTISPSLYPKLPYQASDLAPVINLATFAHILIAPPGSPFTSAADVLASERQRPGGLSVASSGSGTSTHLTIEMLNSLAGTKLVHVPYKGGGAALADIMGGQVPLMVIGAPPAMPLIRAGKLKALAVTTAARMASLPAVPTVAEAGLPRFESIAAQGVFAPAGTRRDIVARLNSEIARIISRPEVAERWTQLAGTPIDNSPDQFAAWLKAESDKWGRIVRESGAKPD